MVVALFLSYIPIWYVYGTFFSFREHEISNKVIYVAFDMNSEWFKAWVIRSAKVSISDIFAYLSILKLAYAILMYSIASVRIAMLK